MAEHDAMMARFVHDYLELLDHRVSSIRHHLDSRNFMTAHVALLSLESTSAMVGAQDLARIAGRLRQAVEDGERDLIADLLAEVGAEADRTRQALGQELAQQLGQGQGAERPSSA